MSSEDSVRHCRSIGELASAVIRLIEKNSESAFSLAEDEDAMTFARFTSHWLAPKKVVCLTAKPGVGSTAFLLGVLMSKIAGNEGVLLFSPRDPGDELYLRLLAYSTSIDALRLAEGRVIGPEWESIIKCSAMLIHSDFLLYHGSPPELSRVRDGIDSFPRDKGKLRLVILDDLFSDYCREEDNDEEKEEILKGLERIAIDCNVAIIVVCKLAKWDSGSINPGELLLPKSVLPQKYHQYLNAIMTLQEDGSRHRLSLYDTDTGMILAMRLTMLNGIGVMTE